MLTVPSHVASRILPGPWPRQAHSVPLPAGGARGRALPARVQKGKCLSGETVLKQPNDAEPVLSFLLVVGPKGSKSIRQKLESFSKEKKGEQPPFYPGFGPCSQTQLVIFDGAELGGAQIQQGALSHVVLLFSRVGVTIRAQA